MSERGRISRVIVTCEHGGNRVPEEYRRRFARRRRILNTHRGYDIGAVRVAFDIADALGAPLFASEVSRLLIDLNRSLGHRSCFSEFSGTLTPAERAIVIEQYYAPYRTRVEGNINRLIRQGARVVHLSIHSFTPVFGGVRRRADVGLLYDPGRARERGLCLRWQRVLEAESPTLRVRRNYPYRGTSDGFTTDLRAKFPASSYLGIEVELNQGVLCSAPAGRRLRQSLVRSALAVADAGWTGL